MAIELDATQPRIVGDGLTGREAVQGFISIRTAGAREVAKRLELIAARFDQNATALKKKAIRQACQPLIRSYKAKVNDITGNLRNSLRLTFKDYGGVLVGVVGPSHRVSSDEWDVNDKKGAGNHAWLIEFGTGPRKPGSQKRRTYLKVHEAINGRFGRMSRLSATFNNEQFERMGRGYYFLMGSKNVPERKSGKGSFMQTGGGETRPYFLAAGETYKGIAPQRPMERTISENSGAVLNTLINSMQKFIDDISS